MRIGGTIDVLAGLHAMRKDRNFVDVELIAGGGIGDESAMEETIGGIELGHAVVLGTNCEFYRNALSPLALARERAVSGQTLVEQCQTPALSGSSNSDCADEPGRYEHEQEWPGDTALPLLISSDAVQIPTDLNQNPDDAKRRFVITHPDVQIETLSLALDYIYSGIVDVPESQLMKLAVFADQILLPNLALECLVALIDNSLSPKTALDFYLWCDKLTVSFDTLPFKARALFILKDSMLECLQAAYNRFATLSLIDISAILAFINFSPLDRWTLLVAWAKARQGIFDLSLQSGIPNDFDCKIGRKDIDPLIGIVGVFQMSPEEYEEFVKPFLPTIAENFHPALEFHFKSVVPAAIVPWGVKAPPSLILNDVSFEFLIDELKNHITSELIADAHPTRSRGKGINLLHRGSIENFSDDAFHVACDGCRNTLVLVKLSNGQIVGGFSDSKWDSKDGWISSLQAFIFSLSFDNNATIFKKFECRKPEMAIYGALNCSACFGDELEIAGSICRSRIIDAESVYKPEDGTFQNLFEGSTPISVDGQQICDLDEFE
ncbi:hypothetical protein HK100_011254, partial [Physocladia obscura]